MAGATLRGWRVTAAVFGVLLVATVVTSCSNDSSSGGGGVSTPTATIFVQNFKYNGVPTTVTSGVNEFLFQNQESFPIDPRDDPDPAAGREDGPGRDR